MTEERLNELLWPCGCEFAGQTIKPMHGDWYVSCWACQKESINGPAYKVVEDWNEARRGEMR